MGIMVLECGCSFSTSMFSDASGGFCICAFHANHPKVRDAKVADLRAVINETWDEWTAWKEKMEKEASEARAQWITSDVAIG